jgi:regulator of sigma E protease
LTAVLIAIIAFVIIFTGVIMAHELGHFITAKLSDVKVEEFGIGYPPRMFGIKRGETIYSINWLPIGGFTKMSGEEDPCVTRSLASKSRATRALVLGAGAIVNALLPFILFSAAYMLPHDIVSQQIHIQEVSPNSPAEAAGLMPGDIILEINGKKIENYSDLQRYTQMNLGKKTTLLVQTTQNTQESRTLVPRWKPPEGQGAFGIMLDEDKLKDSTVVSRRAEPFFKSISMGVSQTFQTMALYKNTLLGMIIGNNSAQLTGPIGIAQITGEVAKYGISPLLELAGVLSLSLAIMNLLPLPALDGGRLTFIFLEWIRGGRRVSPQTEGKVHFAGFIMLLVLMLVLTFQDIARIIGGG